MPTGNRLIFIAFLSLLFAPAFAAGQQRPPTLDPTYGFPVGVVDLHPTQTKNEARWIWFSTTKEKQTVYLRATFFMRTAPKHAILYCTADNFFFASLDGHGLGGTLGSKDGEGWHQVHQFDVSKRLSPGSHTLEFQGVNAGGPAGVLARLQADRKPILLTGKGWMAANEPGGPWQPATLEDPAGQGVWGTDLRGWPTFSDPAASYLRHLRMPVVRTYLTNSATDFDHLGEPISRSAQPFEQTNLDSTIESLGPRKPWTVSLDFGKELTGRVQISSARSMKVKVGTGESAAESFRKPWTSMELSLSPGAKSSTAYSAFRYATLTFPAGRVPPFKVDLDHLYYPVAYKGAFDCSDPMLTKIWYTGAYTAHLCMQEDIWDAPKRDRARWMGDMHVSGEVINNAFLDEFLMKHTMTLLRKEAQGAKPEGALPAKHVNDIPGYSCAWVAGMADFYRHTGAIRYVKAHHVDIVTLLDLFKSELDDKGLFANKHGQWPFVDWAPEFNKDTKRTRETTHMFLVKAATEGAFLLRSIGDQVNARRFEIWSNTLAEVARKNFANEEGIYSPLRQENSMAIYSGVASPNQYDAIFNNTLARSSGSWKQQATPYYNNYFIFALSQSGHHQEALNFVRWYWGAMLAEGATSMWEGYDPTWPKKDFHFNLNADDGHGYYVSLCHGWSAGPTNWLTEEVLGVQPTDGGFKTFDVDPRLGDLKWASGKVPTPNGPIRIRVAKSGNRIRIHLTVPRGLTAHVGGKGYGSPAWKTLPAGTYNLVTN